jgi:hypothetical protein
MKPLSEQFADLSAYTKKAEDSVATARKQTQDKVVALRDKSRATASAAIDKVDQRFKSAGDTATKGWTEFQAKVTANKNALQASIARRKHDRSVGRAEDYAYWMEEEATFAIDYAMAAVEEARLAVLDAIVARLDAEAAKAA